MNIEVSLLHHTPLYVALMAIRQCYESFEKSDSTYTGTDNEIILGPKDKALMLGIIKSGHTSTLEHLTMNFQIKGISRLVLQELARHRIASLSVKSTRYTLKELKDEERFFGDDIGYEAASKYINLTGIEEIDTCSVVALENLRQLVATGKYSNDQAKYALPESYRLDLIWSINVRSAMNFFNLRLSQKAHFEIRELAEKIYEATPEEYKFLFDINK